MKNKGFVISVISIILLFIIANIVIEVIPFENDYKRKEDRFYEAINYIVQEKYEDAYLLSKEIESDEDKKMIENIIDYIFLKKTNNNWDNLEDITTSYMNIMENYSNYYSIYGYANISDLEQKTLDKNIEKLQTIYNISFEFPQEILSQDIYDYYNSYFKVISLMKLTHNGINEKMNNQAGRDKLINDTLSIAEETEKIITYTDTLLVTHTLNDIDKEFELMFNLSLDDSLAY